MLIELIILIIVSLSIGAYLVFFCTTLISLKSSEQRTIARFSTEIEYKPLADNTAEVLWLHYLCQIYVSLLVLSLLFGMTTWVVLICLLI